jgi:c-di-GMP-binding flagellar brake protein YcgR
MSVFTAYAGQRNILEEIGWQGASPAMILAVALVFAGIVVFSVLYYLSQYFAHRRARQQQSKRVFDETVQRLGLSPAEVRKVNELLALETVSEPQVIFQSISLFEKCVDKEVQRLQSKGITQAQRDEENEILYSIRRKAGYHHLALEHPLVSTRNVAIGQVGALYGRTLKKPLIQRVVVVDSNEFSFSLRYAVDKEDVSGIRPGDEVKFAFTRQNDSVYGVPLRILSADGSGIITVQHTCTLRRNQLRQYVRIELSLPLKFRLVATEDPEKSDFKRGEPVDAKMSDISGGGLSFLCERSLRVGDTVSFTFELPAAKFVGIAAKVLRISLQEGKAKKFFKHHVQFVNIEPRRRDQIVKYVFDKQRQISQWR